MEDEGVRGRNPPIVTDHWPGERMMNAMLESESPQASLILEGHGPSIADPDCRIESCGETPYERSRELDIKEWLGADPDLWLYRDRTVGLLRRYVRLAVESGRLPSLLGREFFRTRVTAYATQTFEDTVIFVHDVEGCLALLDWADKALIATILLEENTQEDSARLLGCTHRTIARHFPEALDRISEIFLKRNILKRLPEQEPIPPEACQEEETIEFDVCDSI
jgi:hypothetical protein